MKKWKTLSNKMAFDHRWFKVRQDTVELPNGKVLDDYFIWLSGEVAMVIPVTADGKLVLVKQYKHAIDEIMIEYPAGFVGNVEDIQEAAMRELREETGYTSERVSLLGRTTNDPTKANGSIHFYLAENAVKTHETNFDPNEEIETLELAIGEVVGMIEKGEIWATGTVAATFLALKKLGKLKII